MNDEKREEIERIQEVLEVVKTLGPPDMERMLKPEAIKMMRRVVSKSLKEWDEFMGRHKP